MGWRQTRPSASLGTPVIVLLREVLEAARTSVRKPEKSHKKTVLSVLWRIALPALQQINRLEIESTVGVPVTLAVLYPVRGYRRYSRAQPSECFGAGPPQPPPLSSGPIREPHRTAVHPV